MKNILIVENNTTLAQTLDTHLKSKDFFCNWVPSVKEAISELEKFGYDLIILDRILDDGDGLEVAQFVTDYSYQTKVLMLSELSNTSEKIKGLESGADDYLSKPFSLTELTIKIIKLLNVQKIKNFEELKLGHLVIRPENGEIRINGKTTIIRKKEMQLLTCLIRHKNQVVSRNKIINIVWSGTYNLPTQSTLDVYIRRLRVSLGSYKNYIKTVRGFGYMALE
jgi:DNA-binding response OmpR family regulator